MGNAMLKTGAQKPQKLIPLAARGPPSNTPMPGLTHAPPQTAAPAVQALSHSYAAKSPPKVPFP